MYKKIFIIIVGLVLFFPGKLKSQSCLASAGSDTSVCTGDGSQYRNFIYVEDLADVHIQVLNNKAENQILNAEGMRRISIKEIAETIQKLMGNEVSIEYVEARPGDYKGKEASNDKIKKFLSWEPRVDFEEGMKRTIDWFKCNGF